MDLRGAILAADDIGKEIMEISEWQVDGAPARIELRGINGSQRAEMLDTCMVSHGEKGESKFSFRLAHPKIVRMGVYDPATGQPLFVESDEPHIALKAGGVIDRIAQKLFELSGMTSEEKKKVGKP